MTVGDVTFSLPSKSFVLKTLDPIIPYISYLITLILTNPLNLFLCTYNFHKQNRHNSFEFKTTYSQFLSQNKSNIYQELSKTKTS